MHVSAIKCDFCVKVLEVKEVPDGWATISHIIHIKGTPHQPANPQFERPQAKLYRQRRDAIRAKAQKMHMCDDCVEKTVTGKVSLKLGHG